MRAFIIGSLLIALAGCNDTGVTAYNANPEATITSHADGDEVCIGHLTSFHGSVSDPDDANTSLLATWFVGEGQVCAPTAPDASGLSSCTATVEDSDSEIRLEVFDPLGAGASDSVLVTPTTCGTTTTSKPTTTELNTAPEAPEVSITPADPEAGVDDLVCVVDVESYDVDGDSINYNFEWMVDGKPYLGTPTTTTLSSTISGAETNGGETWTCTVTPNDGTEDGASADAFVIIEAPLECWSLDFDGVDDVVYVPDSPTLSLGVGDFTIEIFTVISSDCGQFAYGDTCVLIAHNEGPNKWMSMWSNTGYPYSGPTTGTASGLFFHLLEGYGTTQYEWLLNHHDAVNLETWQHIAYVRSGTNLTLFVDGQAVVTETFSGSLPEVSSDLTIGNGENGFWFTGLMDEVRISSVARYEAKFAPNTHMVPDADTVGLWYFDEGTGSIAYDSSGNGNHGTIDGATWVEDCFE